ncbi:Pet127-domain-containing protein [Aureobasidium sp. EXF-10727]|nr:Pet127-domain-containing protein [Aureobasidium sp. EXF-10727]
MPSWRTQGIRPFWLFFANSRHVYPPYRLRLFSTVTSRPLRHSSRLLTAEANKDDNTKTATYKPVDTEDASPAESNESSKDDLWPFNKEDLNPSEQSATIKQLKKRLSQSAEGDDKAQKSVVDFFASSNPSSAPSLYDGGAVQSLRDAMLSIKSNPISMPKKTPRRSRARRKRFVNSPAPQTPERIAKAERKREADEKRTQKLLAEGMKTMDASDIDLQRLDVEQPRVPRLHHGLDRVLFSQGVYPLQDRRSKVFNFDPYLQKIMPVTEFDYDALTAYQTSSKDNFLAEFAKKHGKKYVGSTSSMTSTLTHFHYLLSAWRKINTDMFSRDFPDTLQSFTVLNRIPTSIFLRRKGDTYAVDMDKEHDSANVLMLLGRSMEKLLTMPTSEFERYRMDKSSGISEVERNKPESYHYSSLGDFLLRSQLDAQDDRLPGTGMFDLKTRAVLPIRMQSQDHEPMTGYEISKAQGQYESYEREYYDMLRSTALKYSLQARMGHMDGIFVAYHNVKRIFGFQYISLNELDRALHGTPDTTLGNREFNLSISLLNEVFNKATEKFPDQSIRFTFETKAAETLPTMQIFAEPMSEEDIDAIQDSQKEKIAEWESKLRDPAGKMDKEQVSEPAKEDDGVNDEFSDSSSDVGQESAAKDVSETSENQSKATDAQESESTEKDSIVKEIEAIPETSESEPEAESESAADADKPLLGMVLAVRSKVNGVYVERPEMLKKHHDWSIEYSFTEIKPAQAWREYAAAKARRRKTYQKLNNKPDKSDPDSVESSYNEQYINMLKDLSEKGRKIRAGLDEKAANQPKIVVGMPYVRPLKSETKTDDVSIESVDDYLTWLYKEKASPVEES